MPFIAPVLTAASTALAGLGAAGSAGIFGSFLTWLKGGSLLAGVVKMGFSMAAQYALGALFAPKPTAQASQIEAVYGDDVPRSAVLGIAGVAGQHVFRNAYGKGNRRVIDAYKLSDFRISNVTRAKGDGRWRNISDGDVVGIPDTEGDVTVRKHYGTMDQAVDSALVENGGGRWKETSVGSGVAYVSIRTKLDVEGATTPYEPLFEVVGPNLYDWRKDTSVGGDGDDRWNDQDSWSGDPENPVLQMYLLERGMFNGTELMIGKGVPASRLPLAEWTIAANICDEVVGSVPRYRSSLIAGAGEGITHDSNMQPLLEACAASWVEDAGGEYPIVGAAQAVVATFTDDDLVVGESYRFSKYRPRLELVNTVAGSYIDPSIFYGDAPIATRIDEGALIEDNERLAVSLPFKAVTYSEQADRLADIQIRASRFQANAEICLRPRFLAIKPGRWVRWNSAKHGDRTFLVVSKRLGAIGSSAVRNVYLTLQEIGAGVFDPTAYETVPTAPLPPGTPDYASEVDNIVVQPYVLTSESAGEIPAIRVAFDEILDESIVAVDFEYWPTAQPTEINYDTLPMPATVKYLTVGVISNTEYKVRYKLRSEPPRTIPFVGPYTVTTPEAAATDITVKLANLSPSVKALIQSALAQVALAQAQLQQLAASVVDGTTQASQAQKIAVRFQDATAAAMSVLNATISDINGELIAQAEALTAVNATLGTTSAGALFRLFASAGEDDVVAKIELQVRASTASSEWVTAGTIWEVGVDGDDNLFGRIVLAAAQTMIADGMGNVVALFDEDGVHLSNAFIANLTGDHIAFNTLTGDHIVVGSIDSPSLAFSAVTEYGDLGYSVSESRGGSAAYSFGPTVVATVVVDNPTNNPIIAFLNFTLTRSLSGSGSSGIALEARKNGVQKFQLQITSGSSQSNSATIFDSEAVDGDVWDLRAEGFITTGAGSSGSISALSESGILFWKR